MRPATADGVAVKDGRVLLVKRRYPPFKNYWATPGGFIENGETAEEAVVREVFEETHVKVAVISLIGVYSNPKRDPERGTIASAFLVKPLTSKAKGGSDAKEAKWFPLGKLPRMGFDHRKMVKDAQKMLK